MKTKLTKLKRETDKSIIIVINIITHTSLIDRRHKISKDIENNKSIIKQLDPIDIYRKLHHPKRICIYLKAHCNIKQDKP